MRIFTIASAIILSLFIASPAFAETHVGGSDILVDTTWHKADGPFIVDEPVGVPQGVTLTIEPGTVVKMGQPTCNCYVNFGISGTVIAGDTANPERVIFTSVHDDIGGDTDATSTLPQSGDWRMIAVSGGTLELHHVDMKYGGLAVRPYTYFNPDAVRMIDNMSGTVIMDDAEISNAYAGTASYRVNYDGTTTISNSRFHDSTYGVEVYHAGNTSITNTKFSSSSVGILTSGGVLTASNLEFANNGYGVISEGGTLHINNSSLHGNTWAMYNNSATIIDATNNWWGAFGGPTHATNPFGTGDKVSDNVDYGNWLTADPNAPVTPTCTTNCYSNVLFLPGVAGSRLYQVSEIESQRCSTDDGDSYFKRWLPLTDCHNEKLKLNTNGVSLNHIVSKDVIDVGAGTVSIYDSFLKDLKKWKEDESIISDYSVIAYDWRLSVDDILNKGKKNDDGYIDYTQNISSNETPYIMSELLRMASSSRTHKVTIVAHSNGGLITKALMLQLRTLGKEDLVDKIVFIAVPEIGTPDAVATLLHGSNLGPIGIISDKRQTRDISQNMPTAYNLLPSVKYYETTSATIPIATFDDSGLYSNERTNYGQAVGNFGELTQYLLGTEGRNSPEYSDLNSATKANSVLLANTNTLHSSLDAWTPASTTKVVEVAGVGEYTIAGLQYISETYCVRSHDESTSFLGVKRICDEYAQKKILKNVKTIKGDATVVADSAHYLSDQNISNTERWWLDLAGYNPHGVHRRLIARREHKDIFEVSDIRDFIKNQITNSTSAFDYISSVPPIINKSVIRYDLHSPLSLNLFDDQGNHTGISTTTGLVEENIPGTRYIEIGDTKEIIADAEIAQHLMLKGYASGSFSLGVEKFEGDTIVASTTFSAIPSSTSTVVTLDLPPNVDLTTQVASSPLKIDFNGDGVVDTQMVAKPNQETVYDVTPPEVELSFDSAKQSLKIYGYDSVSSTTVATTTASIKVSDTSGNITELLLTKYKIKAKKIELVISAIKQNGVIISTTTIPLTYKWNILNTGTSTSIKTLASYTKLGTSTIETHYRPKKGITAVMTSPVDLEDNDDGDDVDSRATKEKLQGVHIIKLRVTGNKLSVSY